MDASSGKCWPERAHGAVPLPRSTRCSASESCTKSQGLQSTPANPSRAQSTAGFDKLDRVQPTEHEAALDEKTGLPILTQSYGASPLPVAELGEYLTANPLEWSANLYALSITDSLLNTRAKAMNLAGSRSHVYQRLAPEAIDRELEQDVFPGEQIE
jgi:hypothetical protein